MNNKKRLVYGLLITVAIFGISTLFVQQLQLQTGIVPKFLIYNSTLLLLTVITIYSLRKCVNYKLAIPKLKKMWKPILLGFFIPVVVNISFAILAYERINDTVYLYKYTLNCSVFNKSSLFPERPQKKC